jgi:hypothetical protein
MMRAEANAAEPGDGAIVLDASDRDALLRVAMDVEVAVDAAVPALVARLGAGGRLGRSDTAIRQVLSHVARVWFLDALAQARSGTPSEARVLSPDTEYLAQSWARESLPLASLLSLHVAVRDVLFRASMDSVSALGVEATQCLRVLAALHEHFVVWSAVTQPLLVQAFDAEARGSLKRRASDRSRAVDRVLAGASAKEVLGYRLNDRHLGLILWGECADVVAAELARICTQSLSVDGAGDTLWIWLPANVEPGNWPPARLAEWLRARDAGAGLGEPASGAVGFRVSHQQAEEARRVAIKTSQRVVRHDDVALLSLVGRDRSEVRRFVERELGVLSSGEARARELRETLRVYLERGQSIVGAASVRQLHRKTIRQHLDVIEDELRRPVASRSAELLLALRLLDWLAHER